MLMQCCNLVPISFLKTKELIPTAKRAILSESDPRVKLTCVNLFSKIINQTELNEQYVEELVPLLVTVLSESQKNPLTEF